MLALDPYWLVPGLGFAAGFLNVLAGGGSMLSMPGLMMLGLDPLAANATNRLAILVQNAAGVANFHRLEPYDARPALGRAALTVPGAVVGAALASRAPPGVITAALCLALVGGGLHLMRGRRPPRPRAEPSRRARAASMLLIGFYGGFVQAGVGFLFVAVLCGRLGLSLLEATREKVLAVLLYTLPAFALFAYAGQVQWRAGLLLAAGNACGAVVASSFGFRAGERWIRRVLGLALILVAGRLLLSHLL